MSPHNYSEFPMTLSIFVHKLLGEQFSKLYVFDKNIMNHQFKTYVYNETCQESVGNTAADVSNLKK